MSDPIITNVIKQFIRKNVTIKNRKCIRTIGILVAFKHNDVPFIGWSLCHKKDKFNKEFGEILAINRAIKTKAAINRAIKTKAACIPNSIESQFDIFHKRAKRYFQLKSGQIGKYVNQQEGSMGQEYWLRFEKNTNNQVKKYLKDRNFPADENDKSTITIASEKGKVDAWLSWKGQRLKIASQIFEDQSAWCSVITSRLIDLFGCDRVGSDSVGWWSKNSRPLKPFEFEIKGLQKNDKFKEMVIQYKKLQKLFLAEAKRLLPKLIS